MSKGMETECANAIMDGCVEELFGINLENVTPECRVRIENTFKAVMGDDYRKDT